MQQGDDPISSSSTPAVETEADALPDAPVLRQLQQSLLLVQQAFAGVALLDSQGRLLWSNAGLQSVAGPHVALERHLWEVLPPTADSAPALPLRPEQSLQYETSLPTPNATRWLRVSLQPAASAPACFLVLVEDISAQKEAAAAATAQEAQLRYLTTQAPGVLFQWRTTAAGTALLTYCSTTADTIFGFQPTRLQHFADVVHPDDQAAWATFLHPADPTNPPPFEGRLLVPGQPVRWCSGSYHRSAHDAQGTLYTGLLTDITELKTTEDALQDSEYRWLMAIERFGDGAWEFNYQTGDDYFSNAYRAMLGYENEDFPEGFHTWQSHVHPDDQAASLAAAAAYLRGEVPIYSVERRLLCRNGDYKWVLARGLVTKRDAEGKPLIMTGVHTDISEIKRANFVIEAAKRRLSATIANFQEGILLEDENRQVVLVNEAFCRMLQLEVTPEYLVGLDTETLLEATQANTDAEQGWLTGSNGTTLNQHAVIGDLLVRRNGQVFQRDFIPIHSNHVPVGYLWKFQDVTVQKNAEEALKRREEKYRRIIEQMKLGLVETNLAGEVVYVNQVFGDTLGYFSPETIQQNFLNALLTQETSQVAREDEDAYEVAARSQEGHQKWLLVSRAPVYDDHRRPVGTIRITLDITHQKELENKLRTAKEFAEESSRAKELFLANMSHEIRTPMNAILGMSQLLVKTPLTSEQDEYLQAITTSGENLLVIINDILDLSKIEAGQLQVERIGFSASQLVAQIEKTLLYKAEEQGLTLLMESAADLPPVLLGDPYRITQVLLNLAGNAIKFTERGHVALSCELIDHVAGTAEIKFTVTDTGIGIDPAYLTNIFQEFSQEDSSVTRRFGGTGLGLSISKSLVTLMGGELRISSEKNKGTVSTFSLRLPVGSAADLPRKEAANQNQLKKLQGKTVLLVEDNKFNRQIAKTLLTNAQLQVTEAENGALAVDLLRTYHYDLVLMDVQMPVLNGLEATAILRTELGLTTPVIALTANAIKGEREKCLAAGMNDYLAKPFQEEELLKLVGHWVLGPQPEASSSAVVPMASAAPPDATAPLYQLDLLYQIGQGDEDFVALMLESFIENCQEATANLRMAADTEDAVLLKATAHKLKPSLDHLHVYQLLPLVKRLDARTGAFELEVVQPLIDEVLVLLARIADQMALDLAEVKKKIANQPDETRP